MNLPIKMQIPSSFFQEEYQCGFFVDKSRKELWAVELDLLNEFDRVCRKYNLKYFLDGGTLLGAVRHGGFIPWDDDIDINMFREDYDKLVKIASQEFTGCYFFQHHFTDNNYIKGFSKLRNSRTAAVKLHDLENGVNFFNQGIFIDIFPLDYLPEKKGKLDKEKLDNQILMLNKTAKNMRRVTPRKHKYLFKNIISNIRYNISKVICSSLNEQFSEFDRIAKSNSPGCFIDELSFLYDSKLRILKSNWYEEVIYMQFACLKCPIPKEYDMVLRQYYGNDYMVPKQIDTMHGTLVFDSYRTYEEIYDEYQRK